MLVIRETQITAARCHLTDARQAVHEEITSVGKGAAWNPCALLRGTQNGAAAVEKSGSSSKNDMQSSHLTQRFHPRSVHPRYGDASSTTVTAAQTAAPVGHKAKGRSPDLHQDTKEPRKHAECPKPGREPRYYTIPFT